MWRFGSVWLALRASHMLMPSAGSGPVLSTDAPARPAMDAQSRRRGQPVLCAELANRVAYAEALLSGQGVTTYQPGGLAAIEVANLAEEVLSMLTRKEQAHVA